MRNFKNRNLLNLNDIDLVIQEERMIQRNCILVAFTLIVLAAVVIVGNHMGGDFGVIV